jgi:superfamily II DNA/RNA helicase
VFSLHAHAHATRKQDVVAQAATGSGKTAAYLLPLLHRLLTTLPEAAPPPRALVLVPTRELCQQARRLALRTRFAAAAHAPAALAHAR